MVTYLVCCIWISLFNHTLFSLDKKLSVSESLISGHFLWSPSVNSVLHLFFALCNTTDFALLFFFPKRVCLWNIWKCSTLCCYGYKHGWSDDVNLPLPLSLGWKAWWERKKHFKLSELSYKAKRFKGMLWLEKECGHVYVRVCVQVCVMCIHKLPHESRGHSERHHCSSLEEVKGQTVNCWWGWDSCSVWHAKSFPSCLSSRHRMPPFILCHLF